jgi:hypothetical protein
MKKLALLVLTAALSACGGGSDTASSPTVVLGFLASTNVDSSGFPWGSYPGVTKRWALPIPVKVNGEVRAGPAMDAIEAKLGQVVFDRTSLNNVAVGNVTRGIVFSQGTAYLPANDPNPQNYCANVSDGPYSPGFPGGFVRAPGEISARLYVNLDNPKCTAGTEVVIHELGHALGLGSHFQGFGYGPAISSDFWSVLATLYGNAIGTAKANIVLKSPN